MVVTVVGFDWARKAVHGEEEEDQEDGFLDEADLRFLTPPKPRVVRSVIL